MYVGIYSVNNSGYNAQMISFSNKSGWAMPLSQKSLAPYEFVLAKNAYTSPLIAELNNLWRVSISYNHCIVDVGAFNHTSAL